MSAPRMQPFGMMSVTSTVSTQGKLELFGYGQDERVINPGDLMIVSTDYVSENMHKQKIEFALRMRGRDMHLLGIAVRHAEQMWADNAHWLNAPSSQPGVDMRSMSAIRQASNLDAVNNFYTRRKY